MTVFLVFASVIAAVLAFLASTLVIGWVYSWMLTIPFLVSILSFPASPDLYGSILINASPSLIAISIALAISPKSSKGHSFGGMIVGAAIIAIAALSLLGNIMANGIFSPLNVGYLLAGITGSFAFTDQR